MLPWLFLLVDAFMAYLWLLLTLGELAGDVAERGAGMVMGWMIRPRRGGVAAIVGKWPGDETDAEVEEALREMS